jgi:hypothetical protein
MLNVPAHEPVEFSLSPIVITTQVDRVDPPETMRLFTFAASRQVGRQYGQCSRCFHWGGSLSGVYLTRVSYRRRLTEHTLCVMDVAPGPSRRRDSTHDRVLRLMEVFGRVLARRGITTANVTTRLALAKSNPD